MSVYSVNQLIEKINNSSREELQTMLLQFIRLRHSEGTMLHLARAVLGIEIIDTRKTWSQISRRKVIPYPRLKVLANSGMMQYTEQIIRAALRPDGPFQSRDVLLIAASGLDHSPFFIQADGISRDHKTLAGYILQMAGMERKSHFDRERGQPIKAWKLVDYLNLSIKERVDLVHATLAQELESNVNPDAPAPTSLEDLI